MEKHCVLIVDDEANIRSSLTRLLQKEGYDTIFAENAADAFTVLEKRVVSIVLSDFMMPGQSGVEFLKEVKKRFPTPVRIILSGNANTKEVMAAVNAGTVSHFLTKPWSNDILRRTLRNCVESLEKGRRSHAGSEEKTEDITEDLEKTYPGITSLKVTDEGAIIIDE
jgi:DNA-binding NtrC family response regulator